MSCRRSFLVFALILCFISASAPKGRLQLTTQFPSYLIILFFRHSVDVDLQLGLL